MSMVLTEALGPRAKSRVRIANWVTLVVIGLLVAFVVRQLWTAGQLEWRLWEPFTVWINLEFLLLGLANTLKAAVIAMVFSIATGFLFALGRLARSPWVRGLCVSYVEFFRSIPLLLAIFGVFFGLAAAGFDASPLTSLVIALILYNSAVLSEIFRAGINSLDKGQSEAAMAVGLRYWPMMRIVILPQAVRRMIPAIVAQLATLSKDVSLGFVISYEEVVSRGTGFSAFSPAGNLQAYVVVGVIYFILVYLLAKLAAYLDTREARAPKAAADPDAAAIDTEIDLA